MMIQEKSNSVANHPLGQDKDRIRWREVLVVLLLHWLLAGVGTYPAFLFFNSKLIGLGDTLQNAWNLWWVAENMPSNLFPFYTDMLYHPTGVSLAYHPMEPLNGWGAALLKNLLGLNLVTTYNTITILTFVTSGLSTYLLVRWVTKSKTAAFVASLIFTFAPFRMSRVSFGNLEMYSTQFIPLFVLFSLKMRESNQWRYPVLAALAWAMTAWNSLYLALGNGVLALLLFLFDLSGDSKGRELKHKIKAWGLLGTLTLILLWPLFWPMVLNYQDFQSQSNMLQPSISNSADLLGFIVPDHPTNPLIKRASPQITQAIEQLYLNFFGNGAEKTVFVGYIVLILVFLSIFISKSKALWQWLSVAGVFFILCLGPVLHIGGQPVFAYMPYRFINQLPLIGFGRVPSRLAIFLMLALALVAGYALAALEKTYRMPKWGTIGVGVLIFVEFLIIPLRLDGRPSIIPAYYAQLASQQESSFAILDVPIDLIGAPGPASYYMLYQTVHQQAIVSGYISRTPKKVKELFDYRFLNELRIRIYDDHAPYLFTEEILEQAEDDLCSINIKLVILHRNALSESEFEIVRNALLAVLSAPHYEDSQLTVWDRSKALNCLS